MKETSVHSLVIARTLFERSEPLCNSEDPYLATAGLLMLQDAVEVVFYALLLELGVDETRSLERKSFDELIGELKLANVPVPKSGTLKTLNKQRVLAKHYAQVCEPKMVRSFYSDARASIESMTRSVTGRSLQDLFLADILAEGEAKLLLKAAEAAISAREFLDALVSTRKALFVEFEEDFNIYGWRDVPAARPKGNLLADFMRGGHMAPYWKRNKEWIDTHVIVPTDYVQVDYSELRLDAMELGINTVELENLRRLTPAVFRANRAADWSITYDASFPINNATEASARYCLDRTVSILLKKQEHRSAIRHVARNVPVKPPAFYLGNNVYQRPTEHSPVVHVIEDAFVYQVLRVVSGFDPAEIYYEISAESVERSDNPTVIGPSPLHVFRGFLRVDQSIDFPPLSGSTQTP